MTHALKISKILSDLISFHRVYKYSRVLNLTQHNTVQSVEVFINLLKTKRNLLDIRNQSVPRCKHFPPRL